MRCWAFRALLCGGVLSAKARGMKKIALLFPAFYLVLGGACNGNGTREVILAEPNSAVSEVVSKIVTVSDDLFSETAIAQHQDVFNEVEQLPGMTEVVAEMFATVRAVSGNSNRATVHGLDGGLGGPDDGCIGGGDEVDEDGGGNCPRACVVAAAFAAAHVCAVAKAYAVACVDCNGTRTCSYGYGEGSACAYAFGYGFAYACTGGNGFGGGAAGGPFEDVNAEPGDEDAPSNPDYPEPICLPIE